MSIDLPKRWASTLRRSINERSNYFDPIPGRAIFANCKMLLRDRSLLVLMACFAWMQPGCPGIPVESARRNNLSPQTPMRTPVVNGGSLRMHSRDVEGEC